MQHGRKLGIIAICLMGIAPRVATQEVIDAIAARVDTDIILLSDVRELSRYQEFVDGKPESDAAILDRLIDQWIVKSEAKAACFRSHPMTRLHEAWSG